MLDREIHMNILTTHLINIVSLFLFTCFTLANISHANDIERDNEIITGAPVNVRLVNITRRNALGFAMDGGQGAENRQNIYQWSQNTSNIDQLWIEIYRGEGFYSYQKFGTDHCIDGNEGGGDQKNVYLWKCEADNENQHWQKVSVVSGEVFKLVKRNAPFIINGGPGGVVGQNVSLSSSNSSSPDVHWVISGASNLQESLNDEVTKHDNKISR